MSDTMKPQLALQPTTAPATAAGRCASHVGAAPLAVRYRGTALPTAGFGVAGSGAVGMAVNGIALRVAQAAVPRGRPRAGC